jgi:HipA-like protein
VLDVCVNGEAVGRIYKPESESNKYHFRYESRCPAQSAVSLSMPVVNEDYASDYKTLHPVFDMNLPEGALVSIGVSDSGCAAPRLPE